MTAVDLAMAQPMMSQLIYIIEDDASLRSALARLLSASGYRVALFESGTQFLHQLQSTSLELGCILLDINLPGLTGMQLHEQLIQQANRMPIIYLTGEGNIAMSVRAIKDGAEDFLTKPVEKHALLTAIASAMQRFQANDSQYQYQQDIQRRADSLTVREKEVFDLVILGLLNKQIAFQLGNAERTVKAHRHCIMEKMQVNSLAELVLIASQLGLLDKK
jgi:FixJ family two-component response regulator